MWSVKILRFALVAMALFHTAQGVNFTIALSRSLEVTDPASEAYLSASEVVIQYMVDKINADPTLLPNHYLRLQSAHVDSTKQHLQNILYAYSNSFFNPLLPFALTIALQPETSFVTEPLTLSAAMSIPYCETFFSTTLEPELYPTVFRPFFNSHARIGAFYAMLSLYDWRRVFVITGLKRSFADELEADGFFDGHDMVLNRVSTEQSTITAMYNNLRASDHLIVFIDADIALAGAILRTIKPRFDRITVLGTSQWTNPGHADRLLNDYDMDLDLLEGMFSFNHYEYPNSTEQLYQDVLPFINESNYTCPLQEQVAASDCILTIASALHQAVEVDGLVATQITGNPNLMEYVKTASVSGYSGPLSYNSELTRDGNLRASIRQFRKNESDWVTIGSFDQAENQLTFTSSPIFRGGTFEVPADVFKPEQITSHDISADSTPTNMTVRWSFNNSNEGRNVSFQVLLRYEVEGNFSVYIDHTTERSFTISGLRPRQTIYVRIEARHHGGQSNGQVTALTTPAEIYTIDLETDYNVTIFILNVVGLLICFTLHLIVHLNQTSAIIKASTIPLLHVILFGSSIAFIGNILHAFPESRCIASPVFYIYAFTAIFGSLFVRTYRIFRIFLSNNLTMSVITTKRLFGVVGVMMVLETILLVVWMIFDKPVLVQHISEEDMYGRYWTCKVEYGSAWLLAELIPKFIILFTGAYLALKTRNLANGFGESRLIAFSLWNTFLLGGLGIGLRMMQDTEDSRVFFTTTAIWVIVMSTVAILFVPKILSLNLTFDQLLRNETKATVISMTNTNSGESGEGSSDISTRPVRQVPRPVRV